MGSCLISVPSKNIRSGYLLDSLQRGDFNKYPKHTFRKVSKSARKKLIRAVSGRVVRRCRVSYVTGASN